MLIVALVLAVIGLVALVAAVVTTNEVIAWVCIAASALGVVLLVIDAVRERQQRRLIPVPAAPEIPDSADDATSVIAADDTEVISEEISVEDHPEPDYPQAAEEAAMHTETETETETESER